MKTQIALFAFAVSFLFLTPGQTIAQSVKPEDRPASEQSLKDLVNEVRQLRATLQRLNQTVHKTNIVIERLKFQQEQVTRLSREVDSVRESLAELRAQTTKMKELVGRVETDVESGARDPGVLKDLKAESEVMTQRELRLAQRETQLMNELAMERSKLMELTDRLNSLELELK
jgi:myosin heavy subunit